MTKNSRSSIVTAVTLIILFSAAAGLIYSTTRVPRVKPDNVARTAKKHGIDLELDTNKNKNYGGVDFGPYMAKLQRKIKSNWFPPKGNKSKRVTVKFSITKKGDLKKLVLTGTSGIEATDEAALKGVKNAAPFDQLPKGAPEIVDIQFTFDYNVFKHGQKSQLVK